MPNVTKVLSGIQGVPGSISDADRALIDEARAATAQLTDALATATDAAETAVAARDEIAGLSVETGPSGSAASYDAASGTLTVPRGADGSAGQDGVSVTIRTASDEAAAATLSAQYPNDLIVVPE